jgi:WD40 repeat protein/tRNA A-37 threonylcarbamoyl transferase component Bud32
MNPPADEPAPNTPEQELAAQLEQYEEALRSGSMPPSSRSGSRPLPPEAQRRLDQARACVDLLRQVRPARRERPPPGASAGSGAATAPGPGPVRPVDRPRIAVPGYEVLEEVGRGGMGVVYKARQLRLNRLIALKVVLAGRHARPEDLARFRAETEVVARLQHPNIVQIHEVGEYECRPFYVMEFVDGGSLDHRLDGKPQPARESAELVQALARAVAYAHENGVIHRDLKPANILLRPAPAGEPGSTAYGVPKIADFGLAKQLDQQGMTQSGAVIGTPSYMAPEQAQGRRGAAGPSADVYALGVILYELVTGRPPFRAETPLETLRQVVQEEPLPPSRLRPGLPRDLETICRKCLQKEPGKRYATALELAEDLGRFRSGESIRARPVSLGENLLKWARRRPAVAGLSGAMVLLAAVSGILVTWQWRAAVASARAEATARQKIEGLLVSAEVDNAVALCERHDVGRGLLLLARDLGQALRLGDADLERVIRADLTGWRHSLVVQRAQLPHKDWVWAAVYSPDGKRILTGSRDRTAQLWDAETGQPIGRPLVHPDPVWAVAFSPDGKTLLTACGDDPTASGNKQPAHGEARLWDAATGQALGPPLPLPDEPWSVAFHPAGGSFLTVCAREIRIWRIGTGRPTGSPLPHPEPARRRDRIQPRRCAAFSPDGQTVVTAGEDGSARLWDSATLAPRGEPMRHDGPVLAVAFRPDGRALVTGSLDGTARLWDAATGRPLIAQLAHRGPIQTATFSPDGRTVLTGSQVRLDTPPDKPRGEVRLWDAETGQLLGAPLDHPEPVWAVAFSPDGRMILTGCADRAARLWLTATGQPIGRPLGPFEGNVVAVAFSPDGRSFVTTSASETGAARIWTAPVAQAPAGPLPIAPIPPKSEPVLAVSPDGRTVLGLDRDRRLRLWDVPSRRPRGAPLPADPPVWGAAFSPDGKVLALYRGDRVEFWDAGTGRPGAPPRVGAASGGVRLAWGPDGWTLFCLHEINCVASIVTQRLPSGRQEGEPWQWWALSTIAGSADGRLFLAAGGQGVRLWDTTTGKVLGEYLPHEPYVWAAAFGPGGRTFATGGAGQTAQLWQTATGDPLGPPLPHQGSVRAVAFSPDGRYLLTGSVDRTARLWDVATGKPLGPALPHGEELRGVAFLTDGSRAITCGASGATAVWDVPAPMAGEPDRVELEIQALTGEQMDERGVVRALAPEEWQRRRQQLQDLGGPRLP